MSPRALRRAVERQSLKLAVNTAKVAIAQQAPTGSPDQQLPTYDFSEPVDTRESSHHPISPARLIANRANAQLSTGPTTAEGKAKSSMNAVKTGLTGRTVLLTSDDAAIYQQHLNRHFARYAPADHDEQALVQTIADTAWRLLRIAPLEASIYAIGRLELADQVSAESDPNNREALLLGKIFVTYRKDLGNLALQERRLRNQNKTDIAELQQLQQARADKEKEAAQMRKKEIQRAIGINNNASRLKLEFNPAAHGFDFSYAEFAAYDEANAAQFRLTNIDLDFDTFLASLRAASKEPKAA